MTIGEYIFYKIYDRRYRGLCRGLYTMLKFVKILNRQKMKNIAVYETEKYYTVKFSSEVK